MNLLRSSWLARTSRIGTLLQLLFEAVAIGTVSGLSCAGVRLFFRVLQWCATGHAGWLPAAAQGLSLWRRAATPALGGLIALTVMFVARRILSNARSTEYVEAVRFEDGRIALVPTIWRTLSSACSVATGAAIGREGSMIQFAAAVVSFVGQRLRWLRLPLTQQVACGVAAAVAAAYQAPVAGVFFSLEIVMGAAAWRTIPTLLVAALAGAAASRSILKPGPLFALHGAISITMAHAMVALLLAAFLGLLGPFYLWVIRSLRFARRLPLPLFWSGAVVGILSLVSTLVWGNGDAALLGNLTSSAVIHAVCLVLLLRLCATTFCVGTGTVGGVFTPTLFAGSAVGLLLCHLTHGGDPALFAVVGMSCLLAAATHAPLMASFMTVELTGHWILFPLMLACNLVAWQVASRVSRHSLYAIASDLPSALPRQDLIPEPIAAIPEPVPLSHFEAAD